MNDRFLRSATPSGDTNNNSNDGNNNPLLRSSEGMVSDLEQEVLDEYTRLLENVNKVNPYTPSFLLPQGSFITKN
jgi:DASH complex subunit DAD3